MPWDLAVQLLIFSKCFAEEVFSPQHPSMGRANAWWQESGSHTWPQPHWSVVLEKHGHAGMAEDLWSLRLAGKADPAAAQGVIPRSPLISKMSMEPNHAAAL